MLTIHDVTQTQNRRGPDIAIALRIGRLHLADD